MSLKDSTTNPATVIPITRAKEKKLQDYLSEPVDNEFLGKIVGAMHERLEALETLTFFQAIQIADLKGNPLTIQQKRELAKSLNFDFDEMLTELRGPASAKKEDLP